MKAAPTVTMYLAQEAVERAKDGLQRWGGPDLLSYVLSHDFAAPQSGTESIRLYAKALAAYADTLDQLSEAQRIAKWNAEQKAVAP